MLFFVYKTINLVNNKYYIGVHKTAHLNDGYLGSGDALLRAIAKYGRKNFRREIIKFCSCSEETYKIETELVDAALQDPLCYNISRGGSGSFDFVNKNGLNGCLLGGIKCQQFFRDNPDRHKRSINARIASNKARTGVWKRSPEANRKHSIAVSGEKNPQFGTKWLRKDGREIKVERDQLDSLLNTGWELGRINRPPVPGKGKSLGD